MKVSPARFIQGVPLLLCAMFCVTPLRAQASPQAANDAPQRRIELSPGAREVAAVIGVAPLLERLEQAPGRTNGILSLEALSLRQEITEAVIRAALEVDGVTAEIDNELANIAGVRAQLEARRDRVLLINNLASLVTGGIAGIAGTALQFSENTQTTGNIIGVTGSAISTGLSFIGLRAQQGGKLTLASTPNMLARVLGEEAGAHSDYPAEVWAYLSDVPPTSGTGDTRRVELMKQWTAAKQISGDKSPKAEQRIKELTSSSARPVKVTIDLLNDRAAMLADVKAKVALMKCDMSKLMLALKTL
jgi:hypothetical protein